VGTLANLLALATALTVLGPGALAPADAGVLEAVEARRIRYGYGLSEAAGHGVALVAVDDCALLGARGVAIIEGTGYVPVRVVDCRQRAHTPLFELGLVADVNRAELGHKGAQLILWKCW
jgi:hypothetical protein